MRTGRPAGSCAETRKLMGSPDFTSSVVGRLKTGAGEASTAIRSLHAGCRRGLPTEMSMTELGAALSIVPRNLMERWPARALMVAGRRTSLLLDATANVVARETPWLASLNSQVNESPACTALGAQDRERAGVERAAGKTAL